MCDNFYVNRTGIMRVCHESDGKEHSILFGTEGDGLERRYLSFCSNNTEERLRTFMYNVDPKFKRMPGRKMVQHVPLKYIASYLGVAQATLSRLRAKIVRGDRRK